MNPKNQEILERIALSAYVHHKDLEDHLNRNNLNDHQYIDKYQKNICDELNKTIPDYSWEIECQINPLVKDRIDILGMPKDKKGEKWIIELDATRHDQIAAKFMSRLNLIGLKEQFVYVALLYPATKGTVNMSKKYIKYAHNIAKKIKKSSAVGLYVQFSKKQPNSWQYDYVEEWDYSKNGKYTIDAQTNNKVYNGMTKCCKAAIVKHINVMRGKKKTYYYENLLNEFNGQLTIISDCIGKSRYKNTNISLPTKTGKQIMVHTYSQWRTNDMSWSDFVDLCKQYGIIIERIWKNTDI